MSGKLILVRHGETEANVERRLDTRTPGAPLTERGRTQATEFGKGLVTPPAILVHSVALRARQTAGLIAEAIGADPFTVEGIHEVQAGDLEDRTDREAHRIFTRTYSQWQEGQLDVRVPGGESARDVLDRYLPVIEDLRRFHLDNAESDGDVLVVSHGAAIRLVGAYLGGVDGGFATNHHLSNTETVELAPTTDGRWSCVRWGKHTPPFFTEDAADPDEGPADPANPMG